MPETLIEAAEFTNEIVVPVGGDLRKATSVKAAFQALTNRTRYLKGFDTHINVKLYGADPTATAGTNTAAFKAAIAEAAVAGGGVVYVPAGEYVIGADPDLAVGTDEGTGVLLSEGQDNITIRGAGIGRTVLQPVSNKIELFLQSGADNLTLEDLTLDNRVHGKLQNQQKPAVVIPGGGVGGAGNLACCAVRQADGDSLTVRRVQFRGFTCGIHYIGKAGEQGVLQGAVVQEDVVHEDFCFGLLAEQPEAIFNKGIIRSYDCVASVNSGGSEDPGHELYVTNRPGAHPKIVCIEQSYAENHHSSAIKIRKGEIVVFEHLTSFNCGRGPEIWGAKRIVGGNIVTRLANTDTSDTNASGLELSDVGASEIASVFADVRGIDAWGVRVRATGDAVAWSNKDCRLHTVTVINDHTGATGKAAVFIEGQTDFVLNDLRYVHEGAIAANRHPVDVRGSTRVTVRNPRHQTDGTPADAAHLVSFNAGCVDCAVTYSDHDLTVLRAVNTIRDEGAGTRVVRSTSQYYGILLDETKRLVEHMLSEPRRSRTFAIDDTVAALKDAGVWEKLGALWVFAAHSAQAGLLNWKNPQKFTATNVLSSPFTIDEGFTPSAGTADRIVLGDLATIPLYTVNNAHAAVWCEGGTVSTAAMGQNSSAGTLVINPSDGTEFRARMNDDTGDIVGLNVGRDGMYLVSRSASSTYSGYKDGVLAGSVARASTEVRATELSLGRVGTSDSDDRFLMASVGAALTADDAHAFHAIMSEYFAQIGAI
jgi:hypothetical protein